MERKEIKYLCLNKISLMRSYNNLYQYGKFFLFSFLECSEFEVSTEKNTATTNT